jgi:hypothetical protein
MSQRSDATTARDFPTRPVDAPAGSPFVQHAPGPEAPDTRDKAGAQTGMLIILAGGGLFWVGVAAAVAYLLR